ncbi:glycoside hydrolase family 31 protein [Streptomyces sp. ITFR-6]|nr:TIM-barrel domain-containing protein [Streptomyces sp. ITFR-6]WNI33163.1 glycoside hydrolase family 31 protein [Streptomyces sp. ITFR-6]
MCRRAGRGCGPRCRWCWVSGCAGVPYSGPDVGGFDGSPSPELYLRWFQLGAYLPLFRKHAARGAGSRGSSGRGCSMRRGMCWWSGSGCVRTG